MEAVHDLKADQAYQTDSGQLKGFLLMQWAMKTFKYFAQRELSQKYWSSNAFKTRIAFSW